MSQLNHGLQVDFHNEKTLTDKKEERHIHKSEMLKHK